MYLMVVEWNGKKDAELKQAAKQLWQVTTERAASAAVELSIFC